MAQVATTGRNVMRTFIASTPFVDDHIDFELDVLFAISGQPSIVTKLWPANAPVQRRRESAVRYNRLFK